MSFFLFPGLAEDPGERKKTSLLSYLSSSNLVKLDPSIERDQLDIIPHGVLELVREQCVMIQSTANSLCRVARYLHRHLTTVPFSTTINLLEYSDISEVTNFALEQSKQMLDNMGMCKMEEGQRHGKGSHMLSVVHRFVDLITYFTYNNFEKHF